ncbi:UvrD-helicase domain-containing protein [Enterovibrio norvegicus]|uniref:DNA 3'-5' helicase n=1 Tax=Enterovibrio norvegicus TaxID=188144 RepID=A0A2N7LAA9_9GAMM|nr:ATP-dependent helicase [Enterovibrio norvegicus]PMN91367.1 DNA helicase UvrD [Enterovibrio norvegicus]
MISIDKWKAADGLILEPNANRAATENKLNLVLTAGPGAGKTEMLAQRADFLLRTGTCRYPKRILAISFKVDASRNLKERIKRRCGAELSSRFDSYTFDAFAKRIVDRFRPVLKGDHSLEAGFSIGERIPHKQVEFKDLVPLAIHILRESPMALNAVRQTYTDVFFDEFQDCTSHQYELIKLVFKGTRIRVTAVGDTKQKIMGWAGALDGIFEAFRNDFGAVPLNMYRNFRSKPRLLRMQNEIIRVLDSSSVMPDDQISGDEGVIEVHPFQNCQQEAEYLADRIESWIKEDNIAPSEIAVLVRNQPHLYARPLMVALGERGVPYRNEQDLQDISVEPATRLVVDFLLCSFGRKEPFAWTRLMEQLVPFTEDDDERDALVLGWQRFIVSERKNIADNPIAYNNPKRWDCLRRFVSKIGFPLLVSLSHDYENESRLREVLNNTCSKIDGFLSSGLNLEESLKRFEDDQAVRVITVHKSKGLEFDSVVLLGIEKECYFGAPEESLCTYFVGVSRAKRQLLLSHVDFRSRPEGFSGWWSCQRNRQQQYLDYVI